MVKMEINKQRLIKIYRQLYEDYFEGGSKGLSMLIELLVEKGIEFDEDGYIEEE
ncbi:MAG: hypothetical protein ACOCRK_11400 [bacterium]